MENNIMLYGGNYFRNLGDGFVDLGSSYALEQAIEGDVFTVSSVPKSFLSKGFFPKKRSLAYLIGGGLKDTDENLFDLRKHIKTKYIVISGSVLNSDWLERCFDNPKEFKNKKIIFHGVSSGNYDDQETEDVRKKLKNIEPYAIISRDEKAYKAYKGIAEHSYNGIDCAFFIDDYFKNPPQLDFSDFITLTFDKTRDPPEIDDKGRKIIRTYHSVNSITSPLKRFYYGQISSKRGFSKPNTLISDLPIDYLIIYANSVETHADRVHACLPTLMYGNKAKLYIETDRVYLFDRVGIDGIQNKLVSIDKSKIEKEKEKQINFLSEIL